MNELETAGQSSLSLYEALLLRKNALQKECFLLDMEYNRIFGAEILGVFRAKIACARRKKAIEFCQAALNRGDVPDGMALQQYVERETEELQRHLQARLEAYKRSKSTGQVSEAELAEIRRIYRRVAKLIHPDLHPELSGSASLRDLWNQMVAAYECNNLEEMKELEILVAATLAAEDHGSAQPDIPDVEAQIARVEKDIERILTTEPYLYRELLDDEEAVRNKHRELAEELDTYLRHCDQLTDLLSSMLPEDMIMVWDD